MGCSTPSAGTLLDKCWKQLSPWTPQLDWTRRLSPSSQIVQSLSPSCPNWTVWLVLEMCWTSPSSRHWAPERYAKSIFGEDALANVSLEKNVAKPEAPVTGHIRIRAKSQGMALSLGDKINICQKTRQKKIVASQG